LKNVADKGVRIFPILSDSQHMGALIREHREGKPTAAELPKFCAFLHPDAIPEEGAVTQYLAAFPSGPT
jgi:hypothetical protein